MSTYTKQAAEKAGELKESVAAGVSTAQEVVSRRAEQIGHATQGFVEEHPWVCLGIALGFGFTVGRLVARR